MLNHDCIDGGFLYCFLLSRVLSFSVFALCLWYMLIVLQSCSQFHIVFNVKSTYPADLHYPVMEYDIVIYHTCDMGSLGPASYIDTCMLCVIDICRYLKMMLLKKGLSPFVVVEDGMSVQICELIGAV